MNMAVAWVTSACCRAPLSLHASFPASSKSVGLSRQPAPLPRYWPLLPSLSIILKA